MFLRENARESEYAMRPEILIEARETMLRSASELRGLLSDASANEPLPEEQFPLCGKERQCARCNFREVCPAGRGG